jgi:hypothetical protein
MALLVSCSPHLRPGTVITRDCMSAMGSEFEFMNIAAAIAKERCERFSLNAVPRTYATAIEIPVVMAKKNGMIHSSLSLSRLRLAQRVSQHDHSTYLGRGRKRLSRIIGKV